MYAFPDIVRILSFFIIPLFLSLQINYLIQTLLRFFCFFFGILLKVHQVDE